MEALVQLQDGLHVAKLGILVGLGAVEVLAVEHRHVAFAGGHARHAAEVAQIGCWPDQATAHRVGVAGDGAHYHDAGVGALLEVTHEKADEEEVREVVELERLLEAVLRVRNE